MADREEVMSTIAQEVVHRVSGDIVSKNVSLDDSAALLRVNSQAVSRGSMEGMAYGLGTYAMMSLLNSNKRIRAPVSGLVGVIHFVTASNKAKRPEVIIAEFLPCDTPLGDYVRSEVEQHLPADDPLVRLNKEMTEILRANPGISRMEARTRLMRGAMQSHEGGIAPLSARVREERLQRNRGRQEARETEEEREDRALDEEESNVSAFGDTSPPDNPYDYESEEAHTQYGSIEASEPVLEKEYHYDDAPRSRDWEEDYGGNEEFSGESKSSGADDAYMDEFSGVSKLELAKQRRKERIRRQKQQGRRSRYGNRRSEFDEVHEDEEKYHSRYENEYNDSRFGGSSSSRWEDDYNDESDGPTFSRSF